MKFSSVVALACAILPMSVVSQDPIITAIIAVQTEVSSLDADYKTVTKQQDANYTEILGAANNIYSSFSRARISFFFNPGTYAPARQTAIYNQVSKLAVQIKQLKSDILAKNSVFTGLYRQLVTYEVRRIESGATSFGTAWASHVPPQSLPSVSRQINSITSALESVNKAFGPSPSPS